MSVVNCQTSITQHMALPDISFGHQCSHFHCRQKNEKKSNLKRCLPFTVDLRGEHLARRPHLPIALSNPPMFQRLGCCNLYVSLFGVHVILIRRCNNAWCTNLDQIMISMPCAHKSETWVSWLHLVWGFLIGGRAQVVGALWGVQQS